MRLFLLSLTLAAQSPEQFFESKIRPILSDNCYRCHASAAVAGLRVDSREALLKGGRSGPAIVPGKPAQSLLIQTVNHTHPKIKMPPNEKLDPAELSDLSDWVEAGAPWPKNPPTPPAQAPAPGSQSTPPAGNTPPGKTAPGYR